MADPTVPLATLNVSVILGPGLARFAAGDASNRLDESLTAILTGMVRDLALPIAIELTSALEQPASLAVDGPYRVTIGGIECRRRWRGSNFACSSDRELAEMIAEDVFANRQFMLPQTLCGKIQECWAADDPTDRVTSLATEVFAALLRQLVERGSRIDRTRGATGAGSSNQQDLNPIALYERVIAAPTANAVGLVAESPQNSEAQTEQEPGTSAPADVLNRISKRVLGNLGIALPSALEEDRTARGMRYRLRVNDLCLPTTFDWVTREAFERGLYLQLKRNAWMFLTTASVECALEQLREEFPLLVRIATERFDLVTLTGVLRSLLREAVSVHNLRGILESLLALDVLGLAPKQKVSQLLPGLYRSADYADLVRTNLKRYLCRQYGKSINTLEVWLLGPEVRDRLKRTVESPLSENERQSLLRSIAAAGGDLPSTRPIVILADYEFRRCLGQWLEVEFPAVAVLSHTELCEDMNIQPLGEISFAKSG